MKRVKMQLCTTDQTTALTLSYVNLTQGNGHTVPIEMIVRTEKTTKLNLDVVCEKQIGEGSFGVVFKGRFELNDVAVKKMKEIRAKESLNKFSREVERLTSSGATRSSTSTACASFPTTSCW